MSKEIIRRQMIARRASLLPEETQKAAEGLRKQLLLLLALIGFTPGKSLDIGVYSPMRQEADLSPAWTDLSAWPARLFFPAVKGKGESAVLALAMLPAGSAPADFLVPGSFGISEPPPDAWLDDTPPLDVIFVPGLAFDLCGGRLGWGKGYYDRLLSILPGNPVRVGVGYDFQVLTDMLPRDPHDEEMNWLLTPTRFIAAIA